MAALLRNLPLLARADFGELMRRCGVDAEDLQEMIAEIKRLDPKPGLSFGADEPPTLVPDLFVHAAGPRPLARRAQRRHPAEGAGRHAPTTASSSRHALDRPRQGVSDRALPVGQLAGQGARPARAHGAAGRQGDLRPADPVPRRRRRSICGRWCCATSPRRPGCTRARSAAPPRTSTWRRRTEPSRSSTSSPPRSPPPPARQSHSAEAIRQLIKRMIEREPPGRGALGRPDRDRAQAARASCIARRTVAKYRESLGIASSVERRRAKALGR